MNRCLIIIVIIICLFPVGCGYRFVDPFPASDYALVIVRNATAEAGLAGILEEELRGTGGFRESSSNRMSITVTSFRETVESIGSSGSPVRQELSMEISWKVERTKQAQTTYGHGSVHRSYPYSNDPTTLDWNRSAAVKLLARMGARKVFDNLGVTP